MSLAVTGAAVGAASGLYGIYKGIKQEGDASKIKPSPYAKAQLGKAIEEYNGSMPWAITQAQNIQVAQNNANAQAARAATNGGQLLALAQLEQGKANDAYANLGIEEQKYHANMLDNLNKAYAANVNADYTAENEKAAMEGAGAQSIYNGINGIGNDAVALGQYMDQTGSLKKLPSSSPVMRTPEIATFKPVTVAQLPESVDMSRLPSGWLFNL